jgi:hypothetical protein
MALTAAAKNRKITRGSRMFNDQPPKRDLEMIELGVVFALSAAMLIAVMVTVWIVGIKT